MRRPLTALVLLAAAAAALTAPVLSDVCNSAPPSGGRVEINADCGQLDELGRTAAALFYSLDNRITWTELTMTRIGASGYESTYAADLAAPVSGAVQYYVRASSGSNWSTQSPFNAENQWPPVPGLLAATADEPTGDASDPEGPWLDLTAAYVGYSGTHFYVALTNNHTSWPTYSFPQPWYIYSVGLVNPEARSDTWAFALSYANIPGVYTTGLYAVNRYANSFERVADAEAATSGNRLSLRCPISSFTGDPRFGPWPNESGYLTAAANTQAIYPIGGNRLRDTTASCRFYADRSPRFTVGANSPPLLVNPRVVPNSGAPETEFWFNARYIDSDTNLPVLRSVVIDGETIPLRPNQHRYGNGVLFDLYRGGFATGTHRFRFVFNDGIAIAESAPDSFVVIGTGLTDTPTTACPLLLAAPNPFRDRVRLSLIAPPTAARSPLLLHDAAGRVVFSRVLASLTPSEVFDLRPLPSGVYFASVGSSPRLRLLKLDQPPRD